MVKHDKLTTAIRNLESALEYKERALTDAVFYGAIAKAFEVAIEYAWKYFRAEAREAGFEVEAPRDAIKQAGSLKLVDDVEAWLRFMRIRNIAVHDYLGILPKEYLAAAEELLKHLRNLERRFP